MQESRYWVVKEVFPFLFLFFILSVVYIHVVQITTHVNHVEASIRLFAYWNPDNTFSNRRGICLLGFQSITAILGCSEDTFGTPYNVFAMVAWRPGQQAFKTM